MARLSVFFRPRNPIASTNLLMRICWKSWLNNSFIESLIHFASTELVPNHVLIKQKLFFMTVFLLWRNETFLSFRYSPPSPRHIGSVRIPMSHLLHSASNENPADRPFVSVNSAWESTGSSTAAASIRGDPSGLAWWWYQSPGQKIGGGQSYPVFPLYRADAVDLYNAWLAARLEMCGSRTSMRSYVSSSIQRFLACGERTRSHNWTASPALCIVSNWSTWFGWWEHAPLRRTRRINYLRIIVSFIGWNWWFMQNGAYCAAAQTFGLFCISDPSIIHFLTRNNQEHTESVYKWVLKFIESHGHFRRSFSLSELDKNVQVTGWLVGC